VPSIEYCQTAGAAGRRERGLRFDRYFRYLTLLWLVGVSLRLTLLSIPPLIPNIHDELQMNATEVGFLTGLPSLLLAFAAVPGSLLIAKLGVRNALVVGLLLTAIGGALRGLIPDIGWLFLLTIVTSAGVAVLQVTMPPAVRAWVPNRIAFATALYTNGLLVGEVLPTLLTLSMVVPLVGGSWQWALVIWSIPVCMIAVMVQTLAPADLPLANSSSSRAWWPDWRNKLVWRLGLMLGSINALYFATNAFIPDYLREHGQGEWISLVLSSFNAGQLPASALLLLFAHRLQLKVWPLVTCGLLCILATLAIVFGSGPWVVAAAVIDGFAAAPTLILILALPPLISPPQDLHRVTAAMFTISYSCAVIVPIVSGMFWDWSGKAALAFLPIVACGVLLTVLAPSIRHVPKQRTE
jgi:CP family cyanate transporter-like MFS transporter